MKSAVQTKQETEVQELVINTGKDISLPQDSVIFLFVYRNFSMRYLLYSDVYQTLVSSGARIVLFVRDDDLDYYREKFSHPNVVVEPVKYDEAMREARAGWLTRYFVLVRKCVSGSDAEHYNSTDDVRLYLFDQELKYGRKNRLLFNLVRATVALARRSKLFRRSFVYIESRIYPGKIYDEFFLKYKPALAVTSSVGYMIDPLFMRAANRHKVRVVSIIHSWDNPTTKGYRGGSPDNVVVWNELMREEVRVHHDISDQNIFVGGIAHWDFYFNGDYPKLDKAEICQQLGMDPQRKILYYGTSSFKLCARTLDVVEHLAKAIEDQIIKESPQLLVRMHPAYLLKSGKDSRVVEKYQERIDKLKNRFAGLLFFDYPKMEYLAGDIDMPNEDMYRQADLLRHADVLLTEYSTLVLEATFFDVPVVNVSLYNFRDTDKPLAYFENYTHIHKLMEEKVMRIAYDYDQLYQCINDYLRDRALDSLQRHNLRRKFAHANPGTAGVAIGKYLIGLTRSATSAWPRLNQ